MIRLPGIESSMHRVAVLLADLFCPTINSNECWKPKESVLMNAAVVSCKNTFGFQQNLGAKTNREQRKFHYSRSRFFLQRNRHGQRSPRPKSALCGESASLFCFASNG